MSEVKYVDWCPDAAKRWPKEFREWFHRLVGDGVQLPVSGNRRRATVSAHIADEVVKRANELGLEERAFAPGDN